MRHSAPECGIWSTPALAAAASEQAAGLSISHISQRGISGSTNKRRCLWIIWSSLAVEEEGSRFWGVSKYLRALESRVWTQKYLRARSKETFGSCSNRKLSTFLTFLIEEFLAPTIKRHCLGDLEHLEPGGVWPEFISSCSSMRPEQEQAFNSSGVNILTQTRFW